MIYDIYIMYKIVVMSVINSYCVFLLIGELFLSFLFNKQ
jgi:hypothetical protein